MNDFDRDFEKMQRLIGCMIIVNYAIWLAAIIFAVWVIVSILRHYGIVG